MSHISFAMLEQMFSGMRHQAGWNPDADLLWGYFFFDSDRQRLTPLAVQLAQNGYRVVKTFESDDRTTWVLHVERIETHSPRSLQARNLELAALADRFGVESYDGMDAGPVPG